MTRNNRKAYFADILYKIASKDKEVQRRSSDIITVLNVLS